MLIRIMIALGLLVTTVGSAAAQREAPAALDSLIAAFIQHGPQATGVGAVRAYSCSTSIGARALGPQVACWRQRAWMLVFSSALRTKSSLPSGDPYQMPW